MLYSSTLKPCINFWIGICLNASKFRFKYYGELENETKVEVEKIETCLLGNKS